MNESKKILITVSEGSIARNIVRSFVLEKLLEKSEARVALLVSHDKEEWYRKEFGSDRVTIEVWPNTPVTRFGKILSFLSRCGILTKTVLTDQATRYVEDKNWKIFFLKRCITYTCGWNPLYHFVLRRITAFYIPDKKMQDIFKKIKPDLLFSTDVLDEMDFEAMREARRQNIQIVGMVRSWDNLTSGGLVMVVPNLVLLWNPFLYRKARFVQHIAANRLKIVGIPHFDWYTKTELLVSREEFCQKFKIDPNKKIILFGAIGNFLAPHESEVVETLSHALRENKLPDVSIIFRPHPHFISDKEKIEKLGNIIFDDLVAQYTGSERSSWEMDREKIAHLVNSLYHADLVITTASTMTMDAVAFGKPVVCIAFDGRSNELHWNSILRFYQNYTHYIEIAKTKGFKIASSPEELIRHVNEYLKNPELDKEGRQKVFDEFIWKLDGKSAERVVNFVK